MHALFYCSHARATWLSSIFAIRTHTLMSMSFIDSVATLWQPLTDHQIGLFMSILWQIWKA